MPLEPREVAKFRKQIAEKKKREDALLIISKMDPKQTVPVIIKILADIREIDKNHSDATKDYLAYCDQILKDTDDKQNVGIFGIASVLSNISADKIVSDLQKLVEDVKKITVTEKTLAVWQEAECWLEGWFKRTYDMALKEKATDENYTLIKNNENQLKSIDIEDRAFRKITGLTKFFVSLHYHKLAAGLQLKIKEYEESLKATAAMKKKPSVRAPAVGAPGSAEKPVEKPIENTAAAAAKPAANIVAVPVVSPVNFVLSSVQVKPTKDGYSTVSVNVLDGQQARLDAIRKTMSVVMDVNDEKLKLISSVIDEFDNPADGSAKLFDIVKKVLTLGNSSQVDDVAALAKIEAIVGSLSVALVVSEQAGAPVANIELPPDRDVEDKEDESDLVAEKENIKPVLSLYEFLEQNKAEKENVRFPMMLSALDKCKLTHDEIDFFNKHIIPGMRSQIGGYLNAWFSTNWMPTLFKKRSHAILATNTLNSLDSSTDPVDHIKTLYGVWLDSEEQNSKDLYKRATEALDMTYRMLLKHGEQQARARVIPQSGARPK